MFEVGSKRENRYKSSYTVVDIYADSVLIRWDGPERHFMEVSKVDLLKGSFKNPYEVSTYGVGFLGVGKHKAYESDGYSTNVHICWRNMLYRTTSDKHKKDNPRCLDNSVCDEWKCFQIFGDWYFDHQRPGWELDKDLIVPGNRCYSPETCVFLPSEINSVIRRGEKLRGDYPPGITMDIHNKFIVKSCGVYLGYYDSVEEAFYRYKSFKEDKIKELAKYHKNRLDPRAFNALMDYTVSIFD